jgi:hypothetical protein
MVARIATGEIDEDLGAGDGKDPAANHVHTLALNFVFYNFGRIHKTVKMASAMAAGVSNRLWSMEDT